MNSGFWWGLKPRRRGRMERQAQAAGESDWGQGQALRSSVGYTGILKSPKWRFMPAAGYVSTEAELS